MPPSRLDSTQRGVLEVLAGRASGWTLTGGGALAGFYLGHRTTRDLDLFWRGRTELGSAGDQVKVALAASGFTVTVLQIAPAFLRLRVERGGNAAVVDLVAEPVLAVDLPNKMSLGDGTIDVDTMQEILTNKLCALLHRSELRDLEDVAALVEHGVDLERSLSDAPRKERGFSALTLTWVLKEMPIESMARASGWEGGRIPEAKRRRDELVSQVARFTKPADG